MVFFGCGGNDFSGGDQVETSKKADVEKSDDAQEKFDPETENDFDDKGNDDESSALVDPDDVLGDSPKDEALKGCFSGWGIKKVKKDALENVRVLSAENVGPLGGAELVDDRVTDEESIVVVEVTNVGPVASARVRLLNPKGLYCITTTNLGPLASVVIEKHCKANIASHTGKNYGPASSSKTNTIICD
jgi:predicted  nucleic acid-binding Zn-ribbon protein